ncbi:Zinc-finger homeodomain protein 5-like protein [Drosera capensis]
MTLSFLFLMEFRSREKAIAMPNSFGFSAYASQNQESSAPKQLNLAAPPLPRNVVETRDEDAIFTSTVNQQLHQPPQHHSNNFLFQSNNSHQQNNAQRSRRDSDPKPSSGPTTRPNHHDASPSNAVVVATATISTGGVRYRECLRNHAAHLAGHVVDGCGEFMPGGEEGSPESFKCAACDCHRNFHRKETDDEPSPSPLPPPSLPMTTGTNCYLTYHPSKSITARPRNMVSSAQPVPNILQQPPQTQLHHHHQTQQRVPSASPRVAPAPYHGMMMAFGGGVPSESSSDDLNMLGARDEGHPSSETYGGSRKRFRTKFTQDQKQKMTEFAEKLGWRIQKQDEAEVQHFCDEAGVKRQVFKVWMHNNKQAMKRKQSGVEKLMIGSPK